MDTAPDNSSKDNINKVLCLIPESRVFLDGTRYQFQKTYHIVIAEKRILTEEKMQENIIPENQKQKRLHAVLFKSKERFGSWTLAAAAYNAGNGGVNKQITRQKEGDYYDLLLNDETSRYLFRILAFKEILSNPRKYGFNYREKDLYTHIPTYKVKVDTAVTDFAYFAKTFDINYKILKIHNPWLRDTYLNNASRKEYYIEIPKDGFYNLAH